MTTTTTTTALHLQFGVGQIDIGLSDDELLQVDCLVGDPPNRQDQGDTTILSSQPRRVIAISWPQKVHWVLRVPSTLREILIQGAGGDLHCEGLSLERFTLEGAGNRLAWHGDHLGRLVVTGTHQQANLRVNRLDDVAVTGLSQRVVVQHGIPFRVVGTNAQLGCELHAPTSDAQATHRIRQQLVGIGHRLELHHVHA